MKLPKTPFVCKDVSHDRPILVVDVSRSGTLTMLYAKEDFSLGVTGVTDHWWGTHLFKSDEQPKALAESFKEYAKHCGAEEEALEHLSKIITITEEERLSMTIVAPKTIEKDVPMKMVATAPKKKAIPKKKTVEVKTAPDAAPEIETTTYGDPTTASAMFRALLVAGGLSDEEIFAKVSEKFNLEPSKKHYVSWYRNELRKKGVLNNPKQKD